jgi:hypothetical protein
VFVHHVEMHEFFCGVILKVLKNTCEKSLKIIVKIGVKVWIKKWW